MIVKNIFSQFMEKLLSFPLWIKQVIYFYLNKNLKEYLSEDFIFVNQDEIFHIFCPKLSSIGKKELENRELGLDQNLYGFLECCDNNMNILEISMSKFFTMEEISKFFTFALDQKFLTSEIPSQVVLMAGFIAGKYRTGEYFNRSGKISDAQLSEVLDTQKKLINSGMHIMIAELMLRKGLIEEKDIKSIMVLKEESKKRFFLDVNTASGFPSVSGDIKIEADIALLQEENALLKKKLNQLLTFCMDNKTKK